MAEQQNTLGPLFDWRSAVASKHGPSGATTRHVLLTLALHMTVKGENCFPSLDMLVEETGLTKRTVCTHLQRAADDGWIVRQRHGYGDRRWKRHHYDPVVPADVRAALGREQGGERGSPPQAGGGEIGSPPQPRGGEPNARGGERGSPHRSPEESSTNEEASKARTREGRADPEHDRLASEAIILANRGMDDNPNLSGYNPIPTGHRSRQQVIDWLDDGVPWEAIASAVYERAKEFTSSSRYRQVTSMGYFRGAVYEEADRIAARESSVPDRPESALPCTVAEVKTLVRDGGDMLFHKVGRQNSFDTLADKHPELWARAGPVMAQLDYKALKPVRDNDFALTREVERQLEAIGHERAA